MEIDRISYENIGTIIVDSATAYYRFELDDEESSIKTRRELANQVGFLHSLARKRKIVVVITNQVYSNIDTGTLRPIGGSGLEHISKAIVQLEKNGNGKRKATLLKHRSRPEGSTCEFTITSKGVE